MMKSFVTVILSLFITSAYSQDRRHFENLDNGKPYAYYLTVEFDESKPYPVLIGPGDGTKG